MDTAEGGGPASTSTTGRAGAAARGALGRYLEDLTEQPLVVLSHTGLRVSELVALDGGDVRTSARTEVVIVRSGKRQRCRAGRRRGAAQ
ncbi:MAG: hypothetical protein M3296_09395 [Actinomycetota bacterium]|nr:hypothetical protein [Actinomycetota bacterium]